MADPLRSKQLRAGLTQLGEEGAIQVFRPIAGSVLLLGAVGQLQFEVVAHRLEHEYGVKARIMGSNFNLARWVTSDDTNELKNSWMPTRTASRSMRSMRPRCWWTIAPPCVRSSSNGPRSGSTAARACRAGVSVKDVNRSLASFTDRAASFAAFARPRIAAGDLTCISGRLKPGFHPVRIENKIYYLLKITNNHSFYPLPHPESISSRDVQGR